MKKVITILAVLFIFTAAHAQDTTQVLLVYVDTAHLTQKVWKDHECPDTIKLKYPIVACGEWLQLDKGIVKSGAVRYVIAYQVITRTVVPGGVFQIINGKKKEVGNTVRISPRYYNDQWERLPDTLYIIHRMNLKEVQ